MKRLLALTTACGVLAYAPIALAQATWKEVTVNQVGDRFLVDESSIQMRGNSAWYWEYRDFPQPNDAFIEEDVDEPVYGAMLYRSVDCASGSVRLRQLIVHGTERREIGRFDYGDVGELTLPAPGSSAAAVVQYVCNYQTADAEEPMAAPVESPGQ
jgi:hypothetical protein